MWTANSLDYRNSSNVKATWAALQSFTAGADGGSGRSNSAHLVSCRDPSDCTGDLQAAIDSGEAIKLAAGVWTVQPIYLRSSNQTVTFGPDVEVVAKRMARFGVLFTANASANLTIVGAGTRWRMQRADCAPPHFDSVYCSYSHQRLH